ncbi:serine hydrolase domain-containing protein [Leucobacter sp.]
MSTETGYGLNGSTTGFIQVVPPLDQWQFAPYLQWSMQNIQSFLPVHQICRGARTTEFAQRPADLGTLEVPHPWEDRSASFTEVMQATFTDGWMMSHRGAIVGEQYLGTMLPAGMHLLMSVSKSLTATTAGLLAASGELDLDGMVTSYVPELTGSGYEGALVRHLVDMRTGVRFSEEYLNEDAEVRLLEEAIGWAPKKHPDVPDSLLGFLATLGQNGPHGGPFDYKSCETDALGFVIQGAAGRHAADVMSERLWQPMGAEFDAHVGIDSVGAGMFDGGVSAAMRDLARFGHLFTDRGRALDGAQVLPEWWVEDTFAGGPDSREAFANAPEPTLMPGGMYRNGFWFPGESGDVMLALGIHGQMIYMNRATGVVGVKVSSWPTPQDAEKLFWTVRAFEVASWALNRGEI